MLTGWRDGVVTVLTVVLAVLNGCPAVGCATAPSTRGQELATGAAIRDVGPGASVHTLNLDGATNVLILAGLGALSAAAVWLIWRHDPNAPRTPTIAGKGT